MLDYLLKAGRGLLDPSEINNEIELNELIQKRITDALRAALERGYEEKDVNAFLAGLAVLPPPVPLDEYAGAHGIDISAIESFASDLSPLLERTSHGLMFRVRHSSVLPPTFSPGKRHPFTRPVRCQDSCTNLTTANSSLRSRLTSAFPRRSPALSGRGTSNMRALRQPRSTRH